MTKEARICSGERTVSLINGVEQPIATHQRMKLDHYLHHIQIFTQNAVKI